MKSPCFFTLKINKLEFIGELAKPSPVGEGGPRSGFPETSIAQFWGFAMVVDEEFFMFVTTHPSARQHSI